MHRYPRRQVCSLPVKHTAWLVMALLLMPFALFAAPISLVSETMDALSVKFVLPEYSMENTTVNGQTWQKIVSEEGTVHSIEGMPELRVYSVAIAVPVDGDYSLNVSNTKIETLRNINIIPSSSMTLDGDEPIYNRTPNYKAYNSKEPYPINIVEKGEAAFVGNRKFIPLMIYPFQYKAQSKELIVFSEMSISLTIQGTKASTKNWQLQPNPLDMASPSFFLNESSSKAWRREKTKDNSYSSPKNNTTGVNEIQLIVDTEGIYKISYQYLMNYITLMADSLQIEMNWNPASVDPRYLELSDEYGQVPVHFVGENDGQFDVNDYFEFFGNGHRGDVTYMDDYTSENVYTLKLKDGYGARMVVENGGLIESASINYIVPDAYEETVHFEQQLVSDKLGRGWSSSNPSYYKEDNWFWRKINAPNLDIVPIELQYPKDTAIRTASAKVAMMGLTYSESLTSGEYDHETSIRLNQAMINSHTWIGQTEKIFVNQSPISNTFLNHGVNNFYISLSGNTVMGDREQVMLDWAEITYWREYKTDQNYIKFTKPSNRPNGLYQFEVSGFSRPDVSVYKIGSSIFSNLQIEPFNLQGDAPWTVTLQDSVSSTAVRYYATTENLKRLPKACRLNIPSDLRNPMTQADMIVVTPFQFIKDEGTLQLKNLWESKGYSIEIVDIQDIYDEFNSGIVSAEAIKEFITYAYNNWSDPQLSHVLLLGEGVDDTRDNSSSRIYNLIPVKKTWTYKHGATASDNWYGTIVGTDTVPDVSISRIGVWKATQISDYAAKAIAYHNNPTTNRLWNSHLTFTSGGKISDTYDIFAQQSERIRRKSVPQDFRVTRVYTSTQTVSPDYFGGTFNLKDAINSGTQYVQFMGHGGGRIWADYNLFNFNDVATLNNQTYPVVLSLACYASAFDTSGSASISEALVLQPNKGAIGTAGFSGLGYEVHDEPWGLAYCEALFKQDFPNIGEANIFALARFFSTVSSPNARYALTNGFAYLGDPLIKLRKPITEIPVWADNHVLAANQPLVARATFPPGVNSARLFIMKENEKIINVPYDLPVFPDGSFTATYTNSDTTATNYTRKIYIAGYSATDEYVGRSIFSVGRPGVVHKEFVPAEPTWADSIRFTAKVFTPYPVISLICKTRIDSAGTTINWQEFPMQVSQSDSTLFTTTAALAPQKTGKEIFYKYVLQTEDGNSESYLESLVVKGPDLFLQDIALEQVGDQMVLKILGTNVGDATSGTTDLRLYAGPTPTSLVLVSTQDYAPLNVNELRWDTIPLSSLPNSNLYLEARVNSSNAFPEWHVFININNWISIRVPLNYHQVDNSGASIGSIDQNLSCTIPANLVPQGTQALFAINAFGNLPPLNQPDVHSLMLRTVDAISLNQSSVPYEIQVLTAGIVDSLGVLPEGKRFTLNFYYHPTDASTQDTEGTNTFKIYRYNEAFQKWSMLGGFTNVVDNTVSFEVNRTGVYSIFRNTDTQAPSIDVNVQEQEFTVGGYVAGNGVVSLLLSDANGIDVIDNSVKLFINGAQIPQDDYVISINKENINRVPIKYQLALSRGTHELKVVCRDLNGNPSPPCDIQFVVNDKFDVVNLANYPNPVLGAGPITGAVDPKNQGRTRFTYVLTDGADEVTIKVYTISGRLIKTFSNLPVGVGYHEYPRTVYGWDCKDELGYTLANGVYFYRIIARKGGKSIEKTQKMAILK